MGVDGIGRGPRAACLALALAWTAGEVRAAPESRSAAPLSVSRECRVLKDGKPFRGVGVNYYDAFLRVAANPDGTAFEAGFKRLKQGGIPFVRLAVMPFWAREAKPYIDDPERLLALFDRIVRAAEAEDIGLVPSVFFSYRSLPDALGEPLSAWGDPKSRTLAFARDFSRRIAARYRGSRAIWMWEFTNEMNSYVDLPMAFKYAGVSTAQGTPAERTPADNLKWKDLHVALSAFTDAIHAGDPARLVSSGYDYPRNNAAALAEGRGGRDTLDAFKGVMKRDYPASTQVVSVHLYPERNDQFGDRPATAAELIPIAAAAAHDQCKPLFLGEFGAESAKMSPEDSGKAFAALLRSFVASDADLAAMWVYDFAFQEDHAGSYNVTYTNGRAGRLDEVRAANEALRRR